jgi:DNA-binding response OmpR family regulator
MLYDLELSEEGYQILLAENENEAIRILKEECPDLIIIDGGLFLSKGISPLERIRTFCNRTLIVVNDVTYNTCENLLDSYLVDACLVKSSDLDQLRRKIKEVLVEKQLPVRGS